MLITDLFTTGSTLPPAARRQALRGLLDDPTPTRLHALSEASALDAGDITLLLRGSVVVVDFALEYSHDHSDLDVTTALTDLVSRSSLADLRRILCRPRVPTALLDVLEERGGTAFVIELLIASPFRPDRSLPAGWFEAVSGVSNPSYLSQAVVALARHDRDAALRLADRADHPVVWAHLADAVDIHAPGWRADLIVTRFASAIPTLPAADLGVLATHLDRLLHNRAHPSRPFSAPLGSLLLELAAFTAATPSPAAKPVDRLRTRLSKMRTHLPEGVELTRSWIRSNLTTASRHGLLTDAARFFHHDDPVFRAALPDISALAALGAVNHGAPLDVITAGRDASWLVDLAVEHLILLSNIETIHQRPLPSTLLPDDSIREAFFQLAQENENYSNSAAIVDHQLEAAFLSCADRADFVAAVPVDVATRHGLLELPRFRNVLDPMLSEHLGNDPARWEVFTNLSPTWAGTLGSLLTAASTLG